MSHIHCSKALKDGLVFAAFILPALVFLTLFWLIPIGASIGISFTDWDYMTSDFHITGLENYRSLFRDDSFRSALSHTLLFALETVIPAMGLGLLLALVLWPAGRHTIYSLILFSPWITPAVAVSIVWTWIFEPESGLANYLLNRLGMEGLPWLHSSQTALASVALVTVWKNLGYVMLLFTGALSRIPKGLYEAASMDGADSLRRFFYITLPLLRPAVLLVGLVTAADSLRAYDQIQILTQGGPSGSTRTLLYLYYQLGFEQFNMGKAAAAVVVLMAIGMSLALLQTYINRKEGLSDEQ
ncbi:ABC transporter permease subunit [Clostridium sp. MCC353]|uniref:carbohydrate ABC transporter permease n=1 Tax=Clostridium sp. MCC353 TaxID=2592646 RepID=UPI001C0333E6|nr:sugar ABC transporter permease [Clostridium sp. MCC353]MBT9776795.1 ABC transporter permease subunit [Clostridium sp. MCC353]